jgi:hypothetical protein
MAKLFIGNIDQARDRRDAEKSIAHSVERQIVIGSFSDSTYPELIDIERQGRGFFAWGLAPREASIEDWFRMGKGDHVLLGYKGAYRHYGKVLGRYQNERTARGIWGDDVPPEQRRQYLFFMTEPLALGQPYETVADFLPREFSDFERVSDHTLERITTEFGSLDRFIRRRLLNSSVGGPMLDVSGMIQISEGELARLQAFDPDSGKAGRQQLIEGIIRRRGHPSFRQQLLAAYEYRCAITNFNAVDTLEAAYIVPYRGQHTHQPSNGLLLRSDLHTLFDLGKMAIDTRTMSVLLADELMETSYKILLGRPLRYPQSEAHRPSTEALDLHRRLSGL